MTKIVADFIPVCNVGDIADPGKAVFEVADRFVVVFHVAGQYWALDDCCTHDGGPLGEGQLDGFAIACPRHGARFDIRNGRVLAFPATQPVSAHEVKVEHGQVCVRLHAE